jgi:hypothetical protein
MKVKYICQTCKSDHVGRDAWVEWDINAQEWVSHSVYDHATCFECCNETTLEEVEAENV